MNPELWELPRPKSLTTFQGILALIRDLRRWRILVDEAAATLQAEYSRAFPALRLVLFLKDGTYLYWGHFMTSGSVERVLLGPGSRPCAWIRQLGTRLTVDMIARFGEVARSAELHAFDRRAAALRQARRELTRAEQSIRMTLAHSNKHRSERRPLPILPDEARAIIPSDFRRHLGYAWRISLDVEGIERRMSALAQRYRSRKPSRALTLKVLKTYSHLPDAARWIVRGRLLSDTSERLSHRFLWDLLRLPKQLRNTILDFERARRPLLSELFRFEHAYRGMRREAKFAQEAAEKWIAESGFPSATEAIA